MIHWELVAFADLGVEALYEVLTLRQLVFVVEQSCAYLDCDGKDPKAIHLLGRREDGRLVAYARLFPPGVSYPEMSIGRVLTHLDVRRSGVGKELMREAIGRIRASFGPGPIRIGAQLYLRHFYEELGFRVAGDEYLEDGIPHVEMILTPPT